MPFWVWLSLSLTGVLLLFFFLFRVRYNLDWGGGFQWSGTFKYGFPGFMRVLNFPVPSSDVSYVSNSTRRNSRPGRPARSGRSRGRRALFKLLTDPFAIRALIRCGFRSAVLTFRLLNLELDCALGHCDPALLGRMAGYWYAAEPLLPTRRVHVHFHFQDQRSTLRLSVRGGFSAARGLEYAFMILTSVPWWTLSRRAWHGWRNS